jgi:tRNA uridine 5-carbamoylmethylation protein Kti12
MSKLIICSGPSGSGKSTLAQNIVRALHEERKVAVIFSTDNYWIRPDGRYDWNPRLIKEAHEWNYAKFREFCTDSVFNLTDVTAIIDNTNLKFDEFKRYVRLALDHEWSIEIKRVDSGLSVDELAERNIHKVPLSSIAKMVEKWESQEDMDVQLSMLMNSGD